VACTLCGAEKQEKFSTEIAVHSRDPNKPLVFVFPKILLCLNCGKPEFPREFVVPENELRDLAKRDAASGGASPI
jgi:hypothetical protein